MTSSAQPSKGALAVSRSLVIETLPLHLVPILTIRAMEVNRVCFVGFVDETNHRFGSFAYHESWAWCHAIIANELCLAQVRVDLQSDQCLMHDDSQPSIAHLLFKRLDFNFVIIDRGTIGKGELSCMGSVR